MPAGWLRKWLVFPKHAAGEHHADPPEHESSLPLLYLPKFAAVFFLLSTQPASLQLPPLSQAWGGTSGAIEL